MKIIVMRSSFWIEECRGNISTTYG